MLRRLFGRSAAREQAAALYERIVAQAREPAFYAAHGVPDTPEGRFELIVLHLHLVLRRLKREPEGGTELARLLTERFVEDLDQSLRELGVSDLAVGRRVRNLAAGLYGRMAAYDAALQEGPSALAGALGRNLYGGREAPAAAVVAAYVAAADRLLAEAHLEALLRGGPGFPPPP